MANDRDQPWWADAQEYRNRGDRRRSSTGRRSADERRSADDRRREASSRPRQRLDLDDDRLPAVRREDRRDGPRRYEDEFSTSAAAARRRRAAAARAAAQQRRARQRRPEVVEFQWIDDSPFAAGGEDERLRRERDRRARERDLPARRPGTRRPARRRTMTPLARPEKLLLYAALLGLFLILAAATTSDASVVPHALPR